MEDSFPSCSSLFSAMSIDHHLSSDSKTSTEIPAVKTKTNSQSGSLKRKRRSLIKHGKMKSNIPRPIKLVTKTGNENLMAVSAKSKKNVREIEKCKAEDKIVDDTGTKQVLNPRQMLKLKSNVLESPVEDLLPVRTYMSTVSETGLNELAPSGLPLRLLVEDGYSTGEPPILLAAVEVEKEGMKEAERTSSQLLEKREFFCASIERRKEISSQNCSITSMDDSFHTGSSLLMEKPDESIASVHLQMSPEEANQSSLEDISVHFAVKKTKTIPTKVNRRFVKKRCAFRNVGVQCKISTPSKRKEKIPVRDQENATAMPLSLSTRESKNNNSSESSYETDSSVEDFLPVRMSKSTVSETRFDELPPSSLQFFLPFEDVSPMVETPVDMKNSTTDFRNVKAKRKSMVKNFYIKKRSKIPRAVVKKTKDSVMSTQSSKLLKGDENVKTVETTEQGEKLVGQPIKKSKVVESVVGTSDYTLGDSLPEGWRREVVQRQSGKTAGILDAYFYNPDGKRFQSRIALMNYLQKIESSLDIKRFNFSVRGMRDVAPPSM